jgi:hypothetical protein
MADWNTQLEIRINGVLVTPIDSFTPTITTPQVPIHSIEADNVGSTIGPKTATFTMTLKAVSATVAELVRMAMLNQKFDIQVAESTGTDWTFSKLLFRNCLITSCLPSSVVPGQPPATTFNGIILGFGAETDIVTP